MRPHAGRRRRCRTWIAALALLGLTGAVDAQDPTPGRLWRGADGLSGDLGVQLPLRGHQRVQPGRGSQGEAGGPAALAATVQYSPTSFWFGAVTFYRYGDVDQQRPWDPTFAYRLGYDDWHPGTVSLVYANYGGNRLLPDTDAGEKVTRLAQGTLQLQYKVPLPAGLQQRLVPHPSGSLHLRVGYELTPRYRDADRDADRSLKHALTLTARLQPYGLWFAEVGLRAHPVADQQQPWDPDFVYGFGLADWHPGSFSVQYYNYSGNRYPGRDRAANTGRFRDGTVSVSWRWHL